MTVGARVIVATVAVLFLAACEDAVLLDIDVGTTGATRVEFYLATASCDGADCNGIRPATSVMKLDGDVYYRDGDLRERHDVVDGHAIVQIAPGTIDRVKLVLAVGYAGDPTQERAVGFALFEHGVITLEGRKKYVATLEPAKPAPAPGNEREPGTFIHHWNSQITSCVVLEKRKSPTESDSLTIVPSEDPDCDGFTDNLECPGGATIFQHTSPPSTELAKQSCSKPFPSNATGGTTCRLGGGCVDGIDPADSCVPSRFCLPDRACDCDFADYDCLRANLQTIFESTHLGCSIALTGGQPCGTNDKYVFDLSALAQAPVTAARVLPLQHPDGSPVTLADPPSSTLEFADGSKFKVELIGELVTLVLVAPPLTAGMGPLQHALLFLTVRDRELIVPLVIEVGGVDCENAATTCNLLGNVGRADGIWGCAIP